MFRVSQCWQVDTIVLKTSATGFLFKLPSKALPMSQKAFKYFALPSQFRNDLLQVKTQRRKKFNLRVLLFH